MNEQWKNHQSLRGAIVVTGGAMGIGRAAALVCAARGASVAVLDIDPDLAEAVAREAKDRGAPAAIGLKCDVREEASVSIAITTASSKLGPLCGLVTAAGIDRAGLVHELPLDQWQNVLATNLTGTFLACKYALADMIKHRQGGSIVCVSSPMASVSVPGGASAYCASKGGVSALVRSLALDYAQYAIRVNAVVPGATETALMWANVPPGDVADMRALVRRQLALGRMAEPEEIAYGIAWLLSGQSSYATGSHLVIDGGLAAKGSIEI